MIPSMDMMLFSVRLNRMSSEHLFLMFAGTLDSFLMFTVCDGDI